MSQRIVLLVEGYTEDKSIPEFLKRWLDPRLELPVGITCVRFDGWSALVRDAPERTRFYLDEAKNRNEIIGVVGLIDLYGPTFFPPDTLSPVEKYNWAKNHVERLVGHERYLQHFAVHETEAWLLSDPGAFPPSIRAKLGATANAPESINSKEPPAKLLDKIYMSETKRHYKKVTEARNRFPYLDPNLAASKCPFLRIMLEDILALVKRARD